MCGIGSCGMDVAIKAFGELGARDGRAVGDAVGGVGTMFGSITLLLPAALMLVSMTFADDVGGETMGCKFVPDVDATATVCKPKTLSQTNKVATLLRSRIRSSPLR